LTPLLGAGAAGLFLLSLIASGISSSAVGTMAGQPAFVVVGLGADSTRALVLSQVVLSIALPLPMIALLMFTRRADIMGRFVNTALTSLAATAGAAIVLGLNFFLIVQTLGVPIPGLPHG
jgi:manganese transport protein